MTPRSGGRYTFDPGSFSLELLLTGGPPPWDQYEILHTADALRDWLVDSRLALELPLTTTDLRIRPAELTRIKAFRDTLWRVVPSLTRGQRPAAADLDLVNASVGEPPRPQLRPDGTRRWATPVTGAQVLGAAARETIELIGTEKAARVRQCEGVNCHLIFYDGSCPGSRRWCTMQRCGNRHKVSAYRTRRTD